MVGLWLGWVYQQRIIWSHKSSDTLPFPFWPSGRAGYCLLLILAWMTAASLVRLENGVSSVMHSRINIANEYVSEWTVGGTLLFSRSSGAEYLTTSLEATVFETVVSLFSSTMVAIPKSQICASPLSTPGQCLFRRRNENVDVPRRR